MSEKSGEILPSERQESEIHTGSTGIRPRSHASIKPEPKIESLESKRANSRLRGIRGKLAAFGLGVVVGAGGMGIASNNDSHNVDTAGQDNRSSAGDTVQINVGSEQTSAPAANEATETERSIYEKQIEDKYGIELLDQREGYERIGKLYDEDNEELVGNRPVVRWSMKQLINIDEAIAQFPPDFFPEVDGKKFAITLWDYPESEKWGGLAHWSHNMVSLSENAFESGTDLGTLAHEGAHVKDLLVNNGDLGKKASEIIGYESFKEARLAYKPILDERYANKLINSDTYHELNYGFMGYEGKGKDAPVEFIAVLASKYTKGLEEFKDLIELFGEERTNDLYDFIKKEVFDDREYGAGIGDEVLNENNTVSSEDFSRSETVEKNHVIKIQSGESSVNIVELDKEWMKASEVKAIQDIMDLFPKGAFQKIEGSGHLTIVFGDSNWKYRHDGQVVHLSSAALKKETHDPSYEYQIDAVGLMAHAISHRVNEQKGFEPQEKLVELLGGYKFLRNPEKLYPQLFSKSNNGEYADKRFIDKKGSLVSPAEMLSIFAEDYLKGEDIYRHTKYLFLPEDYKDNYDLIIAEVQQDSIGSKIFHLVRDEIFDGREYDSGNKFIPVRIS